MTVLHHPGTVETLEHLADKYSVRVDVIEKEVIGDKEISSSYKRDKILDGDLDCANSLLGRPYIIHGEVLHGRKIGRTLGMPTVNLEVEDNKILPPKGVYASRVIYNGIRYNAVTNIGVKPTIEGDSKLGIESFMFDFNQEIYGENVTVEILSYQRPEQKFSDMDMLKKQMHTDREEANYRIRRYMAEFIANLNTVWNRYKQSKMESNQINCSNIMVMQIYKHVHWVDEFLL